MRRLFIVSGRNVKRMGNSSPIAGDLILATDVETENVLGDLGMQYITISNCVKEDGDRLMNATKVIRGWGNQSIENGNCTVSDVFVYRNFPFWKIFESYISTFFFENNILLILEAIMSTVERGDIGCIISDSSDVVGVIASSVADAYGIEYREMISTFSRKFKKMKKRYMFDYPYRYLTRVLHLKRGCFDRKMGFSGNKRNKILIIPTIQSMLLIIKPLINKLKENPENEILVLKYDLLRNRMRKGLDETGISYTTLEKYSTRESEKAVRKMERNLKRAWMRIEKSRQNVFRYKGVSLYGVMEISMGFFFYGRSRISEVTRFIGYVSNFLETEMPDVVVTLDEMSVIGMPTMIMSRELGISTVSVQHGILKQVGPAVVDKIAVWGDGVKRQLMESNFDKEQIVVTGCPKNDRMKVIRDKETVRKEIGGFGKHVILFPTSPQPYITNKKYIDMLFGVISEFPDARFVVKTHPREADISIYQQTAKKHELDVIIKRNDLYDLINACDIVVTVSEMVALEAALMGKPVIIFNPLEKKHIIPLVEKGVVVGIHEQDKLACMIKNMLTKNEQKRLSRRMSHFIADYAYKLDGKSSERVADVIVSLAKGKPKKVVG